MNKIIGLIPARYKSSRLPGKPLVNLLGKPMILWVLELSCNVLGKENTYVATDDDKIFDLVQRNGYNAILTSENHLTGTDRLAEVAAKIEGDIFINIQGDEPTLNPESISRVIQEKLNNPGKVINAMAKIGVNEVPESINIPKVIFNERLDMVYMSRLPIPGFKDTGNKPATYYKQVCIYAFSKDELLTFGRFGRKSTLEKAEDIEILRFLELDIPVKMVEVEGNTFAVDVIEDIKTVENRLKEIHNLI